MSQPKVSILTTVYNREKYIAACIESVLASAYQDWELIIVDDQSTDASVAIAKKYAAQDSRISVFVNATNLGDYPNRNKAASYAKGKYIKYLDADDLIYPHGLEIMVKTMEDFPEAVLGISQQVAEDLKPYPFAMSPQETFTREFLQRGVLGLGPTGTIIKRDAFEKQGGFTGTRYIGDIEMWYALALHNPVVKMVPGLAYWRQHDDQEITKGTQSYFYLENAYQHKSNYLKLDALRLSLDEKQTAQNKLNQRFARNLLRLVQSGDFKTTNRIRKACKITWFKILQSAL
jgi:glycosyltransferase involved in cell wall biosynthesis